MAVYEVEPSAALSPPATTSSAQKVRISSLGAAVLLLTLFSITRFLLIRNLPLTGDEAYYWQWSRHLALGYHDHPPLVGWLIALSSLLGREALWVRFPSLVLAFLTGLFFFLFTRDMWQDERRAFVALGLLSFVPIFSICSLAIFPDAPLVFSWTLFLWASWKWLDRETYWPVMGLALGLGALSKLMGLFLFPSFLIYLMVCKPHRTLLLRASLWKSVGLAFALTFPLLYWNVLHGFETFGYQIHQRISRGMAFSPSLFLNYSSLQIVSLSPLILFILLATVRLLWSRARRGDARCLYLLAMSLPIHLFFLAASFFTRVGLHWGLPGYLSLLCGIPFWAELLKNQGKRWAGTLLALGLAVSAAFTLFFFSLLKWPQAMVPQIASLGLRYGPVNHGKTINSQAIAEILGYQELGERVANTLQRMKEEAPGKHFVFSDSYTLSSIISFYSGADAKTLLFTSTGGDYDRWNHFADFRGSDALYVDTQPVDSRPDIKRILEEAFRSVTPLPPLVVKRGVLETGTFYLARCVNLTNPEILRPRTPW